VQIESLLSRWIPLLITAWPSLALAGTHKSAWHGVTSGLAPRDCMGVFMEAMGVAVASLESRRMKSHRVPFIAKIEKSHSLVFSSFSLCQATRRTQETKTARIIRIARLACQALRRTLADRLPAPRQPSGLLQMGSTGVCSQTK
jgi:hypothetical protein